MTIPSPMHDHPFEILLEPFSRSGLPFEILLVPFSRSGLPFEIFLAVQPWLPSVRRFWQAVQPFRTIRSKFYSCRSAVQVYRSKIFLAVQTWLPSVRNFSLAVQPSYQSVRNKLSAVQPFRFRSHQCRKKTSLFPSPLFETKAGIDIKWPGLIWQDAGIVQYWSS